MVLKAWPDLLRMGCFAVAAVVIYYKMRQQHAKERAAARLAHRRSVLTHS
jgi:hypothetical protein